VKLTTAKRGSPLLAGINIRLAELSGLPTTHKDNTTKTIVVSLEKKNR
jgi:hypothetical protein